MKKSKSIKVSDSPQIKSNDKSHLNEIEKKIILKKASFKKEDNKKILNTKANTTLTDSSKDEKKETITKKKIPKENNKLKKTNISTNSKEKGKNKKFEISDNLSQKRSKNEIKKIKNKPVSKKKLKNSFSQRHLGKKKGNKTSENFNLIDNKISNKTNKSFNRTDSSNNLIMESDNFIKNLLTNYIDGTDNIINDDLEPFNNIVINDDYENFSFLEENKIDNNTVREPMSLKKDLLLKDEIKKDKINNTIINKKNNNKKKSKIPKKSNNQLKTNIYYSIVNSPNRISEGRFSMNTQTKSKNINKKTVINSPKIRKSLTKPKKIEKSKIREENKESNVKRKILYSKKIINSLNKLKQNKNYETEPKNRETLPMSTSNLNLDIIFENKNIKTDTIAHNYLKNTVSAKNKMVQKKKIDSLEQSKNTLNSFNKVETIYTDKDKSANALKKNILRLNRTPKIQKDFKTQERFSFNSFNNSTNNNIKRNFLRKYSYHVSREFSLENNISGMSTTNNSKNFNGNVNNYLITKELGKGSYAVVKLATHKTTKIKYAIKIYSKQSLLDPQKRNTVKNEINILKQIDNENVMKLYEVIDTPSNLYLVLEYINGINLLEILKNEKFHYIKEQRAKKLFLQVAKGIAYCHQKNIFHRDIKLENILVLKDDTIKIIDFGFGIKCNKEVYQKLFCGTPSYMPPEILKKEKYIASYSDIWSLGVLFYAMLFGVFPFKGKDEDELFEKINENQLIFPEYNQVEDKIKELFKKIFIINPIERISMDDMINILKE